MQKHRTIIIAGWLTGCAWLAGCAAHVTNATPRSVIVNAGSPPTSAANAQTMADAECGKHGRFARMTSQPIYGYTKDYVFDCVQ